MRVSEHLQFNLYWSCS